MLFSLSRFESRVARRIFVEFVLVFFLPLAVLAGLGLERASSQIHRQATIHLRRTAKDASMSFVARLQAAEMNLEMLLGDYAGSGTVVTRPAPARLALRLAHDFRALSLVLDRGATTILGPNLEIPVLAAAEREHLAAGHMLLLVRPGESGPRLLAMIETDGFGLGAGTLVAELDTGQLLPVEGNQGLSLMHEDVVLHATQPELFPPDALAPGVGTEEPLTVDGGQGPHLVVVQRVFLRPQYGLDLVLLVAQPEAQASSAVSDFRMLFALTALLGLLAVLLVGVKRIQKNLVPISVLHEATRRVTAGDLETPVEIRSRDEFEDLGNAFNRMAEQIRARTRELIEASEAKTRFLANASHEIRTPLSSILGYTDLSLRSDAGPAELRENLETIRASGQHLLRLINDILDVSRVEASRLEVRLRPCSARVVLQEALRIVRPDAEARGLTLEIHQRPGVPEHIRSDPDRLRQVLLNLLTNAVKFTDQGGVSVTIEQRVRDGRSELVFEVTDTGPGIAPEVQERLFEPFVQGDSSLSRIHGGAGLGLAISRSLTRLLGGDLTCRSEPGHGTTFTASIDPGTEVTRAEVGGAALPAPVSTPVAPPTASSVLLVEDVAVNRKLVRRYLEVGGYAITEAVDGQEALDKALEAWRSGSPFALILMDIQMPRKDGLEATRELRRQGYDGAIVALTAHAIEGERERCLKAGCDDFLTKPVDREQLLQQAQEWLRPPRSTAVA